MKKIEESADEVDIWIDVEREKALEEYLNLGGSVVEVMRALNIDICGTCPLFQRMMKGENNEHKPII